MSQLNALISVHPEIHFGKPCIAGTRITVANVLELLEAGVTHRAIVEEYYPSLTEEQVRACIRYAIQIIHNDEYHFALEKAA
ncbi:DUF433 domain-containing protein [candidate division KSB1 bacterium]|nr:DUF433 domain-containing protein [candidate division KSB1 bacterium]